MWHVSVSLWSRGHPVDLPALAERAAVALLRGVGDPAREWWFYNPAARCGHLRVPVTDVELAAVPPGRAFHDAGDTGPLRPRTP